MNNFQIIFLNINRGQLLSMADLVVVPILIVVLIGFALFYSNTVIKEKEIRKYFVIAICARIVLSLISAVLYQYFGLGYDTFGYYRGTTTLFNNLSQEPGLTLEIIFRHQDHLSYQAQSITAQSKYMNGSSEGLTVRIGALVALFTANSYMAIGMVFSFFAFLGSWRVFKIFYNLKPHRHLLLAIAILLIPSAMFWSTGLVKDALAYGGFLFFISSFYYVFIKPKNVLFNIILLFLSFLLTYEIKSYIIAAAVPGVILWAMANLRQKVKNIQIRRLLTPLYILTIIGSAIAVVPMIGRVAPEYALNEFIDTAESAGQYHSYITAETGGSGYSLGDIDYSSTTSLLKVIPKSIGISLFGPFIWQASKPLVAVTAIESLITMLCTFFVLFKIGPFQFVKRIVVDPIVIYCFVFVVIFAFAVGLISFNYGTLARYKIPLLPFYFTMLVWLYDSASPKK